MQKLIYELRSYEGSSAPYVESVLNLVVKFVIGEEFMLCSDLVPELSEVEKIRIRTNRASEYQKIDAELKPK